MPIVRSEEDTRELLARRLEEVRTLDDTVFADSVSDVGDHHRKLLERFESFVGALLAGHLENDRLDDMAQDFGQFLGGHFSVEETIMDLLEYPLAEVHKEHHRRFAEELGQLLRMVPLGVRTYGDFALAIGQWLLVHEGTFDAELSRYAADAIGANGQVKVTGR